MYKDKERTIYADEKGIDINGLRFSYETLSHIRNFLRSDGEFEISDDEIRHNCAWCGNVYSKSMDEVCFRSVNGLRFCSDRYKFRVTNLKSQLRRVFKATRKDMLKVEDIAEGLRKIKVAHLTPSKLEQDYLARLENVERVRDGEYRLKKRN